MDPATLLREKLSPPKPPPAGTSFANRTILLTGATSGLGLETAKKLALLSTRTLIITARTQARGDAAKREIEAAVRAADPTQVGVTEIVAVELVMSSFAEVKKFAAALAARFARLDAVILNAGILPVAYQQTVDGWEEAVQINALSTLLLACELLPLLIAAADKGDPGFKPHMSIVSSGTAFYLTRMEMERFLKTDAPLKDISDANAFPTGFSGGGAQYARSKLLLEYAVRHLAQSPALQGADGTPKVIVGTLCPGLCKSGLGRRLETSAFMKFLTWVYFSLLARTTEQGARAYVTSLLNGSHGQVWRNDVVWKDGEMVFSKEGQEFGEKVWSDIKRVVREADPNTEQFLG